MSSETCQLADIAIIQGGYAFKSADFGDEGVAVVKIANIKPPVVSLDDVDRVTPDKVVGLARFRLNDGDVLMAMTGATVGKVGRFQERESAYLNQRVARISARHGKEYLDFIYAVVSQPGFDSLIEGASAGSAQANISAAGIGAVQIPLLDGKEQLAIGQIARALDDRITLLRETNATLEAIAQALFKSWFVDFDPVRAKMEGRAPEGMDEATAALFPDGFETSVLGEVPRGWHCAPVYELATYINGAAYKAFEPNTERRGLPIIKIAELKAGVTSQTAYSDVEMPSKYRIETGDILFSWSGNPDTSIDTFVWTHEEAWLNQHIFRVLPHSSETRSFVLQTLRYLRPVFAELARNKQTTGLGHVTVADMKRLLVVKPGSSVLTQFALVAGPIQEKIFNNARQAQVLCTLRDTLLPRLISGQLRLDENAGAIHA